MTVYIDKRYFNKTSSKRSCKRISFQTKSSIGTCNNRQQNRTCLYSKYDI